MTSIPHLGSAGPPTRPQSNWTLAMLLCCLYAIGVNFEQVVDVAVFKPYRVFGLLLIGLILMRRSALKIDQIARATYGYLALGMILALITQFTMGGNMGAAANEVMLWLFGITTYVAVTSAVSTRQQLRWLLLIFVIALAASVFDMALHARELFAQGIQGRRVTGSFKNPANACINVLLLAVIMLTVFERWGRGTRNSLLRAFLILTSLALIGALTYVTTLTGSRSGVSVYLLGLLVYLLITRRWRLLLIAGVLMAGIMVTRGSDFDSKSNILAYRLETKGLNDSRIYLWMAGIDALTDTYGLGLGMGQYRSHHREYYAQYQNHGDSRWADNDLTLHNEYLSALVEYGALGFCLYLTIWAMIFKRCLSIRDRSVRAIGCAIAMAVAVNAATHHALAYFGVWFFLALITLWMNTEPAVPEPGTPASS